MSQKTTIDLSFNLKPVTLTLELNKCIKLKKTLKLKKKLSSNSILSLRLGDLC